MTGTWSVKIYYRPSGLGICAHSIHGVGEGDAAEIASDACIYGFWHGDTYYPVHAVDHAEIISPAERAERQEQKIIDDARWTSSEGTSLFDTRTYE